MDKHPQSGAKRLPFQGLSKAEWINLALLAVAVYYLAKTAMEILFQNTYMFLGNDFLSFWSTAWLANQRSLLAAYDPDQVARLQFQYIPKPQDLSSYQFYPVITFFLPVFLLPFQALAKLPLTPSFILWSWINLTGYLGYLIFFCRSLHLEVRVRHLVLCALFWPFFVSMFWGQIGLILVVAVGEFLRAFMESRTYRAGFWLAMLLIKPQILTLLPFVLLLQRQWKTLIAFCLTAILLGGISLAMLAPAGFGKYLELSDKGLKSYPTTAAAGMLNWRMLGENFTLWGMPGLGWGLTLLGSLVTLSFLIYSLAGKKIYPQNAAAAFLAIFAASGLLAWHYHIHSAIVLIPFLLYLTDKGQISDAWLVNWIVFPGAVLFLMEVLSLFLLLTDLEFVSNYVSLLNGLTGLILSAWTMVKALELFRRSS